MDKTFIRFGRKYTNLIKNGNGWMVNEMPNKLPTMNFRNAIGQHAQCAKQRKILRHFEKSGEFHNFKSHIPWSTLGRCSAAVCCGDQ